MSQEALLVTPSQVIQEGDDLNPPDGGFWVDDSMCALDKTGFPKPNFSVQETAKVFFGKKGDWLRWRERTGGFTIDGKSVLPRRSEKGNRRYTLADIERMAHALAQNEAIDGWTLTTVIMLIKWQARLHKVIE